jgi:hypothetical protein
LETAGAEPPVPFSKVKTAPVTKWFPVICTATLCPAAMVFGEMELTTGAGLIVVRSVAESLAVFVSPPPDTVAVLVTLDAALEATFTVSVIAG